MTLVEEQIKKVTHILNAANCTECGEMRAMQVNGKIHQPCPDCQHKHLEEKEVIEINRSRTVDYKNLMDDDYRDYEWSVFEGCIPDQKLCATDCFNWYRDFELGNWLIMRGKQGTGKTLIKNLIIKDFGENHNFSIKSTDGYTMWGEYCKIFKTDEGLNDLVDYYTRFDILIIEELGKHGGTPEFLHFMNKVTDNYYSKKKTLIINSNFNLVRENDKGEPHISDFIDFERVKHRAEVINFEFESQRGK
jgi:DNA replication protein DnaC